jgi:hypothetical protein
MPERYLEQIKRICGERPREVSSVEEIIGELDVLYATRVQVERFPEAEQATAREISADFMVDEALMHRAPDQMVVMHPLPRVDEIHPEIDDDPRAAYFEQAHGGVPVRMALVSHLLGLISEERVPFRGLSPRTAGQPEAVDMPGRARPDAEPEETIGSADVQCRNEKCISFDERFIAGFFHRHPEGDLECAYCEEPVEE